MTKFIIQSPEELGPVAKKWIDANPEPTICLLNGQMGAGKTTFIKKVCELLGVTDMVSSPTFSLVNEYESAEVGKIFHFDLYRITDEDELFDFGFEEYIDSKNYVFIEWPEIASGFFPKELTKVNISISDDKRHIKFE